MAFVTVGMCAQLPRLCETTVPAPFCERYYVPPQHAEVIVPQSTSPRDTYVGLVLVMRGHIGQPSHLITNVLPMRFKSRTPSCTAGQKAKFYFDFASIGPALGKRWTSNSIPEFHFYILVLNLFQKGMAAIAVFIYVNKVAFNHCLITKHITLLVRNISAIGLALLSWREHNNTGEGAAFVNPTWPPP